MGSRMTKAELAQGAFNNSWRYNSAIGKYNESTEIGELAFTGVLGDSAIAKLRVDILNHLACSSTIGIIVDLRKAIVPLDGDSVHWSAAESFDPKVRLRPVAVVVHPELETLFLQWAWEMSYLDLMRGAFTEIDDARKWIRSRSRRVTGWGEWLESFCREWRRLFKSSNDSACS